MLKTAPVKNDYLGGFFLCLKTSIYPCIEFELRDKMLCDLVFFYSMGTS